MRTAAPVAAILTLTVALACGGERGTGTGDAGPAEQPAYGDMLVVQMGADADGLLPQTSNSADAASVQGQIFWYLMRSKADFINVEPGLADSFSFSEDSLAIDFFINPAATWHDGHPVQADDVLFGHRVCTAPEVNFSAISWLEHITDVEAIDSLRVRFHFDERYMYQLQDANVCHPLPAHILGDVPMADIPTHDFARNPVGNGPFKFVSWRPGEEIVLEANPDFFRGRPYLNRVTFRIVPEGTTRATQMQNGNADLWFRIEHSFYPQLSADPDLTVHSYPGRLYTYLAFNTADPVLQDVRVRQALTRAIDRPTIVEALLHGQGTVGTQPLISTIWAHDPTIEPVPFDPARAAELLEEAGWVDADGDGIREKDGQRLSLVLKTNADNTMRVDIATIIQEQWKNVGVDAQLNTLEFNTFIGQLLDRDFQTAVAGWNVGIKAELQPTFGSGESFNFVNVENAELDSLMNAATLERDMERARRIWGQAQRIIVDQAYYAFLFQQNDLHVIDKRFQGVNMTPYGWSHYLELWYVPEGRQKYNVPLGGEAVPVATSDTTGAPDEGR